MVWNIICMDTHGFYPFNPIIALIHNEVNLCGFESKISTTKWIVVNFGSDTHSLFITYNFGDL